MIETATERGRANRLRLGVDDLDGHVGYVPINEGASMVVGGQSGSGKSMFCREIVLDRLSAGAKVAVADSDGAFASVGFGAGSSLTGYLGPLGEFLVGGGTAKTVPEILDLAEQVEALFAEQVMRGDASELVLVADDFPRLVEAMPTRGGRHLLLEVATTLVRCGRKYGAFAVLAGQGWIARRVSGELAALHAACPQQVAFRQDDRAAARLLGYSKGRVRAERLDRGEFFRHSAGFSEFSKMRCDALSKEEVEALAERLRAAR
jgi:hypothetical protein